MTHSTTRRSGSLKFLMLGLSIPALLTISLGAADLKLLLRVVDSPGGAGVPARIYLWRDGAAVLPEGLPSYQRGNEAHFLIRGETEIRLPAGTYRLRAERGLEFLPAETLFPLDNDQSLELQVKRWIDMRAKGWLSADMHVHRDPAELADILLAEDLNFAPTITWHAWGAEVRRPWPSPDGFLVQVDENHFYTANSQEIERIQGGPGAIVLFGRRLPVAFSGSEVFPPSIRYTREAHAGGSYVSGDKFFWLDNLVNVALGEIDFIELNCNHFLPGLVDTDIARWSVWPQEVGFFGERGLADWMMNLYYHLLNSGFRLPLSAGSASGVKATPVGYNRVYVRAERPDYDALMQALAAGRSFTTNGPIIDWTVGDAHQAGDRIAVRVGDRVRIRGTVQTRGILDSVQLVANGRVISDLPGEGASEKSFDVEFPLDTSTWLAVRAFERSEASVIFAHTSPIWLLVEEQPVRVGSSIRYLVDKVNQLIEYTRTLDGFQSEEERQETIQLYDEARQVYQNEPDTSSSNSTAHARR